MKFKKLLPFTLLTMITLVGCTAIGVNAENEPTWDLAETFGHIAKSKNYTRSTHINFSSEGEELIKEEGNNKFPITNRRLTFFIDNALYMCESPMSPSDSLNSGYYSPNQDEMFHFSITEEEGKSHFKLKDEGYIDQSSKRLDSSCTDVNSYFPAIAALNVVYEDPEQPYFANDFADCFTWNEEGEYWISGRNSLNNIVGKIRDLTSGEDIDLTLRDFVKGFCGSCYSPLAEELEVTFNSVTISRQTDESLGDTYTIKAYVKENSASKALLGEGEKLFSTTDIAFIDSTTIDALGQW